MCADVRRRWSRLHCLIWVKAAYKLLQRFTNLSLRNNFTDLPRAHCSPSSERRVGITAGSPLDLRSHVKTHRYSIGAALQIYFFASINNCNNISAALLPLGFSPLQAKVLMRKKSVCASKDLDAEAFYASFFSFVHYLNSLLIWILCLQVLNYPSHPESPFCCNV